MPNLHAIGLEGLATDYPAGALIRPHAHGEHQIVHALAGVMRVTVAGGIWVVPPGRALWVPAETRHEICCIGQLRMRTVYLRGRHPAFPSSVRVTRVSDLLREIMVRLAEGAPAHQMPHFSALLVDEIAASTFEPLHLPAAEDPRVARLTAALLEAPAEQTALPVWAGRLGLSPRTLIRRIRQQTGMSFRELRRQARILAALERLPHGHSITEIACDVGFESPSAFIQAFRRVTGKTPGRYAVRGLKPR